MNARLAACDQAESVLHIFEEISTGQQPRRAIETARRYAIGNATNDELHTARNAVREVYIPKEPWATWAAWTAQAAAGPTRDLEETNRYAAMAQMGYPPKKRRGK